MQEQLEISYVVGRSTKWYHHFGKLLLFYKVKHVFILSPRNFTFNVSICLEYMSISTKTHTRICRADLLKIATLSQKRNQLFYRCTVSLVSAMEADLVFGLR